MKENRNYMKLAVALFLIAAMLFAGCGINEELDSDFEESYEKGMSGGLSDTESEEIWPETMPDRIPEFEKGTIVNSSAMQVGGQMNIEVNFEDVEEVDLDEYITKLEQAGFETQSTDDSGSIRTDLLAEKGNAENAISLSYASKTGELVLAFSGT